MSRNDTQTVQRTPRRRLAAVVALAIGAIAATSANAVTITTFPARDFVEVGGLASGDVVDVDVIRLGRVVARSRGISAFAEPPAPEFVAFVNHPGGADTCWEGSTPDLVGGDLIRATITAGPGVGTVEEATVADIAVTEPATAVGPSSLRVRGYARTVNGHAVQVADLEQRLIHEPNGDDFDNATGRLTALGPVGADGVLAFDGPGATTWTATYSGLSAADHAEGLVAESRIQLGSDPDLTDPDILNDLTIYEFGVPAGPFDPACPPVERGPSLELASTSDSGVSASDRRTNDNTPTLTGLRGTPGATDVTLYTVSHGTLVPIGTAPVATDGTYSVTPAVPLTDGLHVLYTGHLVSGPSDALSAPVTLAVDTTAPISPFLSSVDPASPADHNLPVFRGSAEPGTTVHLFTTPMCEGAPTVSGPAATFATTGLAVPIVDYATMTVRAIAEDAAGNVSTCSISALPYRESTPRPVVTVSSTSTVVNATGRTTLRMTCRAPMGATCTGRLTLVVTVPRPGTKPTRVVIARAPFALSAGAVRLLPVKLTPRGRALLRQKSGRLRVTIKLTPDEPTRLGVASQTRVTLTTARR